MSTFNLKYKLKDTNVFYLKAAAQIFCSSPDLFLGGEIEFGA